jgi:copper/silver efflux system protein
LRQSASAVFQPADNHRFLPADLHPESQEGRLFGPLAFTKTFAMAAAALLSVTLVPALMVIFVRGVIIPEHRNPINRLLIFVYRPDIRGVLRAKTLTILLALVVLGASIWPGIQLGSEFMPSLNEGTLMYMPTTLPGLSVTKAAELLQTQDRIIKSFPEWIPSTARPDGLCRRPILRRPKCLRP